MSHPTSHCRPRAMGHPGLGQAGFSMIEMMMTALILAIGILGLTALQAFTLTTNARSKGFNSAVEVAGHILENIESQARQRWLIKTDDPLAVLPVYTPNYFAGANVTENFTFNGHYPDPAALNLDGTPSYIDRANFFTAVTSSVPVQNVAGSGTITNYTVTVTFQEAGPGGPPLTRTVAISRTVLYGN